MQKLKLKDKQHISAMIQRGEGECVARPEQRVQHWNVTYLGHRYRILYDKTLHQVQHVVFLGVSPAESRGESILAASSE